MSATTRRAFLTSSAAMWLIACARKTGPLTADPLVERQAMDQLDAHGPHTVELRLVDGRVVSGKLVAVDERGLSLMDAGEPGVVSFPVDQIAELLYRGVRVDNSALAEASRAVLVLFGGLLLAGLIFFLLLILALAAKGSCPFVYVVDPRTGKRRLVGEAYSGAVVKALARTDRMALPPSDGEGLQLVLANEAPETQYTDAAWVEVVDHAPTERIAVTHAAELVRIGPSVAPVAVEDLDGVDQTAALRARVWTTDLFAALDRDPRPSREGLVARFAEAPRSAALEVVVRNSPWLDRVSMLGWAAMGGGRREAVQRRGASEAAVPRTAEMMQQSGVHARIEVRQGGEWREVASLPPVGWVAERRVVVPLAGVEAGAPVEVRLSGGIGFLMVLELGLTSVEGPVEAVVVPARAAVQSTGEDERARLAAVDGDPNVLEALHESVAVDFALPPVAEGRARSLFLYTHGYYEVHPPDDFTAPRQARALLGDPADFGLVGLALFEAEFGAVAEAR